MLRYFKYKSETTNDQDDSVSNEATKDHVSIPCDVPVSNEAPISTPIPIDSNEKWVLEADPAKRKQILEFPPNEQDEVRRAYLLKGPTRIYMAQFPDDENTGRSFAISWYKYDWLEYSIKEDSVFCLPCYLFYNGSSSSQTAFVKDGYRSWHMKVVSFCGNLEIDVPDMESRYVKDNRSKRKAPFVTAFNYFKYDCFFGIIDLILAEMNARFTPENTELLHCVECLNPCSSFEAFDTSTLVRMSRLYPNDFLDVGEEELTAQLESYINCVRIDDHFSNLNGLTDLCKTLVRTKKHKTFRFVYKLVKLALTLPVATATVERAFSGMKYVKDELRNRMANPWLNDCLVTFVEKDVFSTVDDLDIIKRFQEMRARRMQIDFELFK